MVGKVLSVICALVLVESTFAASARAATTYSLTDLGDLPGGPDFSEALDLNASGAVVGTSVRAPGPGIDQAARRGFFWQSNVMVDVGDLPGGNDESWAVGLNASGQVVGYSDSTTGRRPFLWQSASGLLNLSTEPGGALLTQAADINDAGQVVGIGAGLTGARGFLWESGSLPEDLGVFVAPNNPFSVPTAITTNGFIVGWASVGTGDGIHGVSWSAPGAPNDLDELDGGDDRSIAFDANDVGQIVGRSNASSGDRAVLWQDGGDPIDLGDLAGGEDSSEAQGVNALGEIVGVSKNASGDRGVLWDSTGGPYDLNDRLDASGAGYEILRANAINDAGQIAADAKIGSVTHGVLLTPAPEPGALAQTLTSVIALALWAFRRSQ